MGRGERGEGVYSSVLLPGYGNFNINVCRPVHVPLWFQPYSLLLPKQYTNDGVCDAQKMVAASPEQRQQGTDVVA